MTVRTRRRRVDSRTTTRLSSAPLAALLAACVGDGPTEPPRPPLAQLPPDLAGITFTAQGTPTAPYVVLEIRQQDGFSGFVIVNGAGQPVWYYRTQTAPFSFTRRLNGNFVFLDSDHALVEMTVDGEVVRELAQEQRPGRHIHHDVLATDANTVLFIAEEWRDQDGVLINGEAIWEWTPESGLVEKRWSAFDHLDPGRDWGPRSVESDWLHANALSRGPRGNFLLSLHFLDQIVSIAPDLRSIEWRLGGTNATITIDDPFSGQHTAVEVRPNRVLLFDNGFDRSEERFSRAADYEIDGEAARKVWEWRPERDNWARVISSARRLPNGNTMVAFGVPRDFPPGSTGPIEVFEVTEAGAVVWHLAVSDNVASVYRATPLFDF